MDFSQDPMTIFTIPKAFEGHNGLIQLNAIKSWTQLRPKPQIIVFGDDTGVNEACRELDVVHVPDIKRNEHGTPLLSSVFRQAQELSQGSILTYINADIILLSDFLEAVQQLLRTKLSRRFLMIGRRIDMDIKAPLDFQSPAWDTKLQARASTQGALASVVCRDYFVFPKPLYAEIPSFAVGRGHWDSWMVYHAHQLNVPVVDATTVTTTIHQNHNYTHLSGNRGLAYVKGAEAQENARLAGGMHVFKGAATNWTLTPSGIQRNWLSPLTLLFDTPRYLNLLFELFSKSQKGSVVKATDTHRALE